MTSPASGPGRRRRLRLAADGDPGRLAGTVTVAALAPGPPGG